MIGVTSFIILYADDMLWAANKEDEKLTLNMLKELEVGEAFSWMRAALSNSSE